MSTNTIWTYDKIYEKIHLHRAMLRYEPGEFKSVISYHFRHSFIRACVHLQFRPMTFLWDQAGSLIISSDKAIEYVLQFIYSGSFPMLSAMLS